MKANKWLTKRDALLILLILGIGLSMLALQQWRGDAEPGVIMAEIRSDDGAYFISLDENRTFYIIPNVIFEVRDGQIAFVKSDCPDQICVRTGFIHRSGQMAACLPNGLVLFLSGTEAYSEPDIFVR